LLIGLQLLLPAIPPDIRLAANNAGSGTGGIEQDTVKALFGFCCKLFKSGVATGDPVKLQTIQILAQQPVAPLVRLNSGDPPPSPAQASRYFSPSPIGINCEASCAASSWT